MRFLCELSADFVRFSCGLVIFLSIRKSFACRRDVSFAHSNLRSSPPRSSPPPTCFVEVPARQQRAGRVLCIWGAGTSPFSFHHSVSTGTRDEGVELTKNPKLGREGGRRDPQGLTPLGPGCAPRAVHAAAAPRRPNARLPARRAEQALLCLRMNRKHGQEGPRPSAESRVVATGQRISDTT